jgi:hypothetical protein
MNKQNLISKKFKQRFLSINNSIESFFNKLKFFKSNFKINEIIKNNRVFFGSAAVVILTLSYFLVPTIYDENVIKGKIKNHISKKYNFNIKFSEKINYGFLPKPHFHTKNLIVLRNNQEIGIVKDFDAFFGVGNFFSIDNLELKDLILKNGDFKIRYDDMVFFENLLKTEPNENKILFKKTNIFFNNFENELLFLDKIKKGKFYYDANYLENVLETKSEIFNIPYKLEIRNNEYKKELLFNFNAKKIRLDIENNINYSDKIKNGVIDVLFVNKKKSLNYEIKKNSLIFSSEDDKTLNGFVDFKPFYLRANLNYNGISTKDLFKDDSLLVEFIKSEILNNRNLNVNINLTVNDITNIDEFNNLYLLINLEQGDITFSKSKILWKDDLEIILNDGLLTYNNNEISLLGKLVINANNINDFYKSFQIKKNDRKEISQLELDFVYNFSKNKITFDNVKIDEKSNDNIDQFIKKHNSNNVKFYNKINFKNFVNNFFSNYSG